VAGARRGKGFQRNFQTDLVAELEAVNHCSGDAGDAHVNAVKAVPFDTLVDTESETRVFGLEMA
jgi:hypothetical protein